jgi:hypothetical protein
MVEVLRERFPAALEAVDLDTAVERYRAFLSQAETDEETLEDFLSGQVNNDPSPSKP